MSASAMLLGGALLAVTLPPAPPAGPCPAHAARRDERAFLELTTKRVSVYVHETFRVELRFGFERSFLEHNVIQPFQRSLGVPAQLHAGWLEGLPCARPLPERAAPSSGASFVLEDALSHARRAPDEVRDGRAFVVYELERSFLPTCQGPLVLGAPHLRFAFATRFRRDAFGDRIPEDRQDEVVTGLPLELKVLALPEVDRPAGFTGAVGRFVVRAEAAPTELAVGESLKLVLIIEGDGDLTHFDAPRLDLLEGFGLRGWVEETLDRQRRVTYDLAPLTERVLAAPALTFPFFDPGPPAGYRVVRTQPIPLRVAPRPTGEAQAGDAQARSDSPTHGSGSPRDGSGRLGRVAYAAGLALLLLCLAVYLRRQRRRRLERRAPADPQRTRAALEALGRRAQEPGADLAQALAEYLAERLGCPVPAVIGRDLRTRLAAAAVPEPLASRAATLLEELVSSRYGGHPPSDGLQRARTLIEELEAVRLGAGPAR